MCIINFHFQDHSTYKLVVVANRDEFYDRPTKSAHFWEDDSNVLAGRDLLQNGTWLGISKQGRFAAVTNYRDPSLPETGNYSRGEIVRRFLIEEIGAELFMKELKNNREQYGGYNILLGNGDQLFHYNNILDETNIVSSGTHSLSNHSLNTPWPKVEKGKEKLHSYVEANQKEVDIEKLFEIVADQTKAADERLPQTGVGLEMERALSPIFVKIPNYGTRSSTVLLIDKENQITFVERTFQNGKFQFDKKFEFKIKP